MVNSTAGWQTVSLTSPVSVTSGQKVWLSFVFQNNPGVRFTTGSPGRALSSNTWTQGLPVSFGTSTIKTANYSVFCNYNTYILKDATIPEIIEAETVQSLTMEDIRMETNKISIENSVHPLKVNDFKLYPNPANSFVNVNYSFIPETGTRITIVDGTGRIIDNYLVNSSTNKIDVSQLPDGLYFIKSINPHLNITKKLIIKND